MQSVVYHDKMLRMARDSLKKIYTYSRYWGRLPPEKRFGLLESCQLIKTTIPHLRGANLTKRQARELDLLVRKYQEAKGLLKIMEQWDKEWHERERNNE